VQLDPSEENYFAWGSELLLHRAVWQAQEVLRKGAKTYPQSARMLSALAAALFAGARYHDAAQILCQASELDPADPAAYLFMGKVQIAAPDPLPCVEKKLARFVAEHPDNSQANYLYAMAIVKGAAGATKVDAMEDARKLLTKAVTVDPKCADGYLELGILAASSGDTVTAIGDLNQAISADPELSEAHYRLGVAYGRIGQPEKAAREFALHDELEKRQADEAERQRREIKQFVIVTPGEKKDPPEN
jgi:tetratricopeptide (TPR) repeat protein